MLSSYSFPSIYILLPILALDPFGFCGFQYSCNESINYNPVNLIIIWTFYRSKTDCYGKHETLLEINSRINCYNGCCFVAGPII